MIYSRVLCLHQRLLGIIKIVILAVDRWVEERIQSRSFMLVSFLKCSMSVSDHYKLFEYISGVEMTTTTARQHQKCCACLPSFVCLSVFFFILKIFCLVLQLNCKTKHFHETHNTNFVLCVS